LFYIGNKSAKILDASGSATHRFINIKNLVYNCLDTTAGTGYIVNDPNSCVVLDSATIYNNSGDADQQARVWKQTTDMLHTASVIGNTPAGSIAATTVQAAIDELDTEKAAYSEALSDTYTYTDVSGAGLAITSTYGTWRRVGKTFVITGNVVYPVTADASVAAISSPYTWKRFNIGAVTSDYATAIVAIGNTATASISFDTQVGTTQVTNANLSGKTIYFTIYGALE
jgi:hypothetical protein